MSQQGTVLSISIPRPCTRPWVEQKTVMSRSTGSEGYTTIWPALYACLNINYCIINSLSEWLLNNTRWLQKYGLTSLPQSKWTKWFNLNFFKCFYIYLHNTFSYNCVYTIYNKILDNSTMAVSYQLGNQLLCILMIFSQCWESFIRRLI